MTLAQLFKGFRNGHAFQRIWKTSAIEVLVVGGMHFQNPALFF
jgi:hypothetical protein